MGLIYGLRAIYQAADANQPHVLGFKTARSAGDDNLVEFWNGSTVAAIKATIDKDGKYYSAALTAGDLLYGVTGGISNVRRLDSLAISTARKVLQVNAAGTLPEWTDSLSLAGLTVARNTATVTDPTTTWQNLDETAATLHTILHRYQFNTTVSATVTAAEWIYSKEQEWTSTGTTQDTKASLWLAQNGSLVEILKVVGSDKSVEMFGHVGIGRTPTQILDVFKTSAGNIVGQFQKSGGATYIMASNPGEGFFGVSGAGERLSFLAGNATKMSILASGKVLISDSGVLSEGRVTSRFYVRRDNVVLDDWQHIMAYSNDMAADKGGGISLAGTVTGTPFEAIFANVCGRKLNSTSGNTKGYFQVGVNDGSAVVERYRITDVGYHGFGTPSPSQFAHFAEVETITGAVTDGYAAALRLDPGYTAASALAVTRHNYIDVQDVSLAGAGPAALTDACLFRFDAALGTHAATTNADKTANAKSGTIIINVNGTLLHIQLYAN